MDQAPVVDHVTQAALDASLDWVRSAPIDPGRLELIVARPDVGERQVLAEAELDLRVGLVGDTWHVRTSSSTEDGSPHPDKQLTLINVRLAEVVAGGRERMPLAGDQLFVDLDLSVASLPAGSRLSVGDAVVEISDSPHLGCAKFVSRFGAAAMRFVNSPVGRSLRLRGANARVVVPGTIRQGDQVTRQEPPARSPR